MKCLNRSAVPSWHCPYHGNACATKHREYNEDEIEGTHDAAAEVVRVASIEGSTQRMKQGTYDGRGDHSTGMAEQKKPAKLGRCEDLLSKDTVGDLTPTPSTDHFKYLALPLLGARSSPDLIDPI
jgi:hypothetical protein